MANQELITYVRNQLSAGKTREEIIAALTTSGGWNVQEAESTFSDGAVPPVVSGVVEVFASRMVYRFIDTVILIVSLVASYWVMTMLDSNSVIAPIIQGKEAYIVLVPPFIVIIAVNYFRRKKTVAIVPGVNVKVDDIGGVSGSGGIVKLLLVTATYSWAIAPLFTDAGSMGGISAPVPGAFFLIPIFGWIAAVSTLVGHPGAILGLWFLFTAYLSCMISLSRSLLQSKVFRFAFALVTVTLCWLVAAKVLPVMLR